MSVKRKDLIKYLEENGFYLLREGGNHSIYPSFKHYSVSFCSYREWSVIAFAFA